MCTRLKTWEVIKTQRSRRVLSSARWVWPWKGSHCISKTYQGITHLSMGLLKFIYLRCSFLTWFLTLLHRKFRAKAKPSFTLVETLLHLFGNICKFKIYNKNLQPVTKEYETSCSCKYKALSLIKGSILKTYQGHIYKRVCNVHFTCVVSLR